MAPGDVYADIVGSLERRWPPSYNTVITKPCPNCGAAPGDVCTYAPAARTRRAPCVARTK